MSRNNIRLRGYNSYTPGVGDWDRDQTNPYTSDQSESRECWNDGWERAKEEYERNVAQDDEVQEHLLNNPLIAVLIERVEALEERVADLEII